MDQQYKAVRSYQLKRLHRQLVAAWETRSKLRALDALSGDDDAVRRWDIVTSLLDDACDMVSEEVQRTEPPTRTEL